MAWLDLGGELDKRDLSMYKFARMLNVPTNTVLQYFKEGVDPRFSTVMKWAKALDCEIEDLINLKLSDDKKTMPRPKRRGKKYDNTKKTRR
ncbi:MAG: helix-turn-helix domain-containing protein [Pseudobdellovibrionaceae bacterium]